MIIESDLEDANVKANCSYAKELLEVEFDEEKVTDEEIRNIVKVSGYTLVSI